MTTNPAAARTPVLCRRPGCWWCKEKIKRHMAKLTVPGRVAAIMGDGVWDVATLEPLLSGHVVSGNLRGYIAAILSGTRVSHKIDEMRVEVHQFVCVDRGKYRVATTDDMTLEARGILNMRDAATRPAPPQPTPPPALTPADIMFAEQGIDIRPELERVKPPPQPPSRPVEKPIPSEPLMSLVRERLSEDVRGTIESILVSMKNGDEPALEPQPERINAPDISAASRRRLRKPPEPVPTGAAAIDVAPDLMPLLELWEQEERAKLDAIEIAARQRLREKIVREKQAQARGIPNPSKLDAPKVEVQAQEIQSRRAKRDHIA